MRTITKTMLYITCAATILTSHRLLCMLEHPLEEPQERSYTQIAKDTVNNTAETIAAIDYKGIHKWLQEPVPRFSKNCLLQMLTFEPYFKLYRIIADPKKYLLKHE